MRKERWKNIFKFALLYFLVFLAVEMLLMWAGLWKNEEKPFWLILLKSLFMSVVVTLVLKLKEIRLLLKKRSDEGNLL